MGMKVQVRNDAVICCCVPDPCRFLLCCHWKRDDLKYSVFFFFNLRKKTLIIIIHMPTYKFY